jgi:hypothetical protein
MAVGENTPKQYQTKGSQHSTTHRETAGVVQFVEHLLHHPKVVGLSPAKVTSIWKKYLKIISDLSWST